MARQLVLALISVAIIGMAMANEAPSAPASDPIELYAPEPEPFEDPFTTPEETDPADVTSGASALQFSGAVTAAAIAGIFAF